MLAKSKGVSRKTGLAPVFPDTTLGTTIANLGMSEVTFPKPVFHGDTLHVRTEVVSVRESRSRPTAGVVEFRHTASNQDDVVVAVCVRAAFMKRESERLA